MTDIVFVFEVHQPYRIKSNFFWEKQFFIRLMKSELFDYYFNRPLDKEIFNRACKKCYFPSNQILLNLIDDYKKEKKQVKFSFSISGTFLEQCEMFNKDLLESFKQLVETGCVELLNQTYYHSLASLYPDPEEFIDQIKMHQQITKDLLGTYPSVFENTELLYNNAIAKIIEKLGFKGIFTEGVERILHEKSPNYLYTARGCKEIKVLMRNYKLTDDIGFRFSASLWDEWPLTADKFARWLAETSGECINIFPDYETFGEHHWPETGIHKFLNYLPREIMKFKHLTMSTPSEIIKKYSPKEEINVPELGGTVSWADLERDASSWLGNTLQWAYYTSIRRLEPFVKETENSTFLRLWRYFQISDHLYYMCTSGGTPGEVHSYFSPFKSPSDAYVTAQSVILDFEHRVRLLLITADEPFTFQRKKVEKKIGIKAWSLKGFIKALQKVDLKTIEFHTYSEDFEKWALASLKDKSLAKQLKKIRLSKLKGQELKKSIMKTTQERYKNLYQQIKGATEYLNDL